MDLFDKRKNNKGRPRTLTVRHERAIQGQCKCYVCVQEESQLTHVSAKNFRRALKRHGFKYLQSRKSGIVVEIWQTFSLQSV